MVCGAPSLSGTIVDEQRALAPKQVLLESGHLAVDLLGIIVETRRVALGMRRKFVERSLVGDKLVGSRNMGDDVFDRHGPVAVPVHVKGVAGGLDNRAESQQVPAAKDEIAGVLEVLVAHVATADDLDAAVDQVQLVVHSPVDDLHVGRIVDPSHDRLVFWSEWFVQAKFDIRMSPEQGQVLWI